MECSACTKIFTSKDKVVMADCGCLVHVFKINCCSTDYCLTCQRQFHISTQSPLVSIKDEAKNEAPPPEKSMDESLALAMKALDTKFQEETEAQKKRIDDFMVNKLKEQRKINLELMKKITVLNQSQVDLLKVFQEQTLENQKVIQALTKELVTMKNQIQALQEDYACFTDSCGCAEEDSEEN